MIENNSRPEYFPRWLGPELLAAASEHAIVVLTGPRQVGKSWAFRNESPFCDWPYRTLDEVDVLGRGRRDPSSLWAGTDRIVLDEVQRAPELLLAVKAAVDSGPHRRFALSGSANLLLMSRVSESLAGRAAYFDLLPMTWGEVHRQTPSRILADAFLGRLPQDGEADGPEPDAAEWMIRGFLPPVVRMPSDAGVLRWWEGYVTTYLERDLRQLSQIEALPEFRDLMQALALRCGQLLNESEVGRDVGLSQATAHRYTRLLEVGGLFVPIPAFGRNRTLRLMKRPKAMWVDPGLACFLAGLHDPGALRASREAGRMFEALVFLHLRGQGQVLRPRPRIHHWRTTAGVECDFVLEQGRNLVAVEAKLSSRIDYRDADDLETFLREYPEATAGLVVYSGRAIRRLSEKVVAIPWWL